MVLDNWLRCWSTWKNPFAEFEIHHASLAFFNSKAEDGYSIVLSRRLARQVRHVGFILLAVEVVYIAYFMLLEMNYDGGSILFRIKLVSLGIDALMGFAGLALGVMGCCQTRRPVLSPTLFEFFVVACLILILAATPFTEAYYVKSVGWPTADIEVAYDGHSIILLMDCLITVASLMPLRWSALWIVYVLTFLWYPVAHGVIIGMPSWGMYAALVLLIICSAFGKRDLEVQDRRLFSTIVAERTMRASTEFQLSQTRHSQEPVHAPSTAESLETGEVFNLIGASTQTTDIEEALTRVKTAAEREQWLVCPEDILIDMSKAIGRGGFGAVLEASWSGLPVALKLSLEPIASEVAIGMASLVTELRVLRKVRHPNIVLFLGAVIDPSEREVALLLELVAGPNLSSYIRAGSWGTGPLPDPLLYSMSGEILRAVRYLHSHHPAIVHGDLKPTNIVLEQARSLKPRAKLVDFGLSRILTGKVMGLGGTFVWKAPELHNGDRRPKTSVDIYGVGRLMIYMMVRSEPFHGMSMTHIREAVAKGELPRIDLPDDSSAICREVWSSCQQCVTLHAGDRPSAEQMCERLLALGDRSEFRDPLAELSHELWGSARVKESQVSGEAPRAPLPWKAAIPKIRKAVLNKQRAASPTARQARTVESRSSSSTTVITKASL